MTSFLERAEMARQWQRDHSPEERREGNKAWARRQARRLRETKAACKTSLSKKLVEAGHVKPK